MVVVTVPAYLNTLLSLLYFFFFELHARGADNEILTSTNVHLYALWDSQQQKNTQNKRNGNENNVQNAWE